MDSNKASYDAGQAKGQTQEKASNMMDKASNTAQSAKESMQEQKPKSITFNLRGSHGELIR
ncbi:hypothetical protein RYX36_008806, partial [Vicia faba]